MPADSSELSPSQDAMNRKREMLSQIDRMRTRTTEPAAEPLAPSASTPENGEQLSRRELEDEVKRLRLGLKAAHASTALLEADMQRLEQKALESIAETGRLRREISSLRENAKKCGADEPTGDSTASLTRQLRQSRHEHLLLTEALSTSESEIARLTKSLEYFARKLAHV